MEEHSDLAAEGTDLFFPFTKQSLTAADRAGPLFVKKPPEAGGGGSRGRRRRLSWESQLRGLNELRTGSFDLLLATKTNAPKDT